jgi:SAM-dependent methyltransferase
VGIDHNPRYITKASQHYRGNGRFFVADVREISELVEIKFDRVLLIGVLHHLDDSSSRNVIVQARSVLKQGGRLICYDPTFVQNQHPISYFISRFDRGRFVRKPEEYEKLLCEEFQSREVLIRNDLLWLPSATVIISARLEA